MKLAKVSARVTNRWLYCQVIDDSGAAIGRDFVAPNMDTIQKYEVLLSEAEASLARGEALPKRLWSFPAMGQLPVGSNLTSEEQLEKEESIYHTIVDLGQQVGLPS
jgi:hypothetical protein